VAEVLRLDAACFDEPLQVGLEIHAVARSLDAAEVSVRLDVRDEQDVNVGRAEVLGNQIVVARKQLGYQAAEHDRNTSSSRSSYRSHTSASSARARVSRDRRSSIWVLLGRRLGIAQRIDELRLDVIGCVLPASTER
jgi:hypothetical protein